ncbi:hypothetical protein ACH5RR_025982 [Cinchona calisaya]|uniref:Uncharacterized protein n=1 Tax=Cinchona calisaya TaxID=153742 RepID=A0ABD2Z4K5_9GENT
MRVDMHLRVDGNNNGLFIDFNEKFEFDEDNFSSNSEGFDDEVNDYDELVSKFEGDEIDGFVLKDLYNKMDIEMKREIATGDAKVAIGYLAEKKDADKMFYYKNDTNEKGGFHRLFWVDS